MKIYSKETDYYDSVLKFSQTEDDGVVYSRLKEETFFGVNQVEIKPNGYTRHFVSQNIKFIGFCGKIYTFTQIDFCFDANSKVETFFIGHDDSDLFEKMEKYNNNKSKYQKYNHISYELDSLLGNLNNHNWWSRYTFTPPFKLDEFFIKYSTPIFLFETISHSSLDKRWKLTTNCNLAEYGFQRIVDPFTAFQEISMFFNSTLTNLKTPIMPVGSDKVISESKGFDKWSFRKMGENSKL